VIRFRSEITEGHDRSRTRDLRADLGGEGDAHLGGGVRRRVDQDHQQQIASRSLIQPRHDHAQRQAVDQEDRDRKVALRQRRDEERMISEFDCAYFATRIASDHLQQAVLEKEALLSFI